MNSQIKSYKLILLILILFVLGGMVGVILYPYFPIGDNILRSLWGGYYKLYSLAENRFGGKDRIIYLKCRTANTGDVVSPFRYNKEIKLDLDRTALVLIDVWKILEENNKYKQNIRSKIKPLVELARKYDITIVHASHGREISSEIKPFPNEFVISSDLRVFGKSLIPPQLKLDLYLKSKGINTLLYAGYATNACILFRPTGIIKMKELGYSIILVRDATLALELPSTRTQEWVKKSFVYLVEDRYGCSTTLKDLQKALHESINKN